MNPKQRNIAHFLHKKFLRFDKTQPFISITALLAFLGIGVGVMVLIVAMAIMNGMSKEFEKRLFVMSYPLTLYSLNQKGISEDLLHKLESHFPNLSFSPYLYSQAVARINGTMDAAIIFGIDPKKEAQINPVFAKAFGSQEALEQFSQNKFGIIIGQSIVYSHFLNQDDKITLYFTKLEPTGLVLSPVMKRFSLFGSFSSGISAYDSAYMYANKEALAAIKGVPQGLYDGVHIFSKEPMKDIVLLREFLDSIKGLNVALEGWWQKNANLFAAMNLEKHVLFIVLMLIILMASLNIISSLLMVVMNRRKEIALLLSLGASKAEIKKTFFYLGMTIGILGIVFGVGLSFVVLWVLDTFPIISLPADVYGTDKLPLDLSLFDFVATIIGAIIIVCLSSYYPARQASKIDSLSVLRNE
ncbi:ABC transporter permease [Helicobacter fennelliae]|uniref:ABC transporter permease n=1 Tax=Helicobacter fennelliae TaxID=215 RepID=UPI000DFBCC11|nr:ABC transporter permease [Helicobacter fennelliae]STQ83660.1 Lipoprotein releasing system transmembrane protein LolC [Helicobacter fennelliae]